MVGTAVGASGVKVAGSWVVVIVREVAGMTVSRFGTCWQAARVKKTNNKILFKCKFYPLFDFGKLIGNDTRRPSAWIARVARSTEMAIITGMLSRRMGIISSHRGIFYLYASRNVLCF
jgi:hypothetical protein